MARDQAVRSAAQRLPRVAHILPWPTVGGVEKATVRIVEAMNDQGFESVAFSVGGDTPVMKLLHSEGIATAEYEAAEPSYRHPVAYLQASLSLARELRRRKIDLVHCSDLLAGYHAGLAARLAGVPCICHIRCEYASISLRDRSFLRLIRQFVFVSEHTRATFPLRIRPERATVLYDGLTFPTVGDQDLGGAVRSELGIAADAVVIGMIARLAPIKDYPTLIRAARRVADRFPAARFLVVGDYSGAESYRTHFQEVKRAVAEAGLTRHFIFTGHRPDVQRLLAAMDVVVLVTHSEGLPLVVLEAMGAGKPVVATAVGGIPEIIKHGETGLLHRTGDHGELATLLCDLICDPARASVLARAGRRDVISRFGQQRFAWQLATLYGDVLGARRRGAGDGKGTHIGSNVGADAYGHHPGARERVQETRALREGLHGTR